jgi:hypothetical protein
VAFSGRRALDRDARRRHRAVAGPPHLRFRSACLTSPLAFHGRHPQSHCAQSSRETPDVLRDQEARPIDERVEQSVHPNCIRRMLALCGCGHSFLRAAFRLVTRRRWRRNGDEGRAVQAFRQMNMCGTLAPPARKTCLPAMPDHHEI